MVQRREDIRFESTMENDITVTFTAPLSYETWSMGRCLYRCIPCRREFCHSIAFWEHVKVTFYKVLHAQFPIFLVHEILIPMVDLDAFKAQIRRVPYALFAIFL